ncbi:MAG: hypothetical protein FJZ00_14880, partial [Candidatus Sericytochromatia bacterium]|nr:hypothetical protein [Candidatus Tanganyikabacteria bacterium]
MIRQKGDFAPVSLAKTAHLLKPIAKPALKAPAPKTALISAKISAPLRGGSARIAAYAAPLTAAPAAPEAPAAPPPSGQKKVGDGLQAYERRIERDAPNSEDQDATRIKEAKAAISANTALEAEALAKLTPDQRAQYNRVAAQLAGKPEARLALQNWLTQSTLGKSGVVPASCKELMPTGRPPLSAGLLTQFDKVATQQLDSRIDRSDLLAQLVRETADPTCINQKSKGSCVATSVTIKLALSQPAEYVRLVAGLATPGGTVKLANGDTIRREADWENNNDGGRALPEKLLQPALMDYGNRGEYDNSKDKSSWWGLGGSGGTPSWGRDKMLEGLFDKTFDTVEVMPW